MMTGAKILVGVVGVGYLGKFHAEKYAASNKATLVGVVDVNEERALEIAKNLRTQALTDYRQLFGQVQCVSIAVPTQLHYRIARDFLEAGVDVLVEKPLTPDIAEARDLVDLAQAKQRILQVGHLERFNPAIRRLESVIKEPTSTSCSIS